MNGYLNGKSVYLCGPIKMAKDDGVGWREEITPRFKPFGITVLNPCEKTTVETIEIGEDKNRFREMILQENFGLLKKNFWAIIRSDLKRVDASDFLVLNYDPDIPTVGSVHELCVSNYEKKVVLLKYNKSQLDRFNPWIAVFIKEHHFFSEWDKMFEYLEDVNQGKMDTSLWVI
jgi:hypothetical protein